MSAFVGDDAHIVPPHIQTDNRKNRQPQGLSLLLIAKMELFHVKQTAPAIRQGRFAYLHVLLFILNSSL